MLHIILEDGFICVLHYMMLGPALARPDNAFTSGTIPRLTLRKNEPLVREQWWSKELSCVLAERVGTEPTSILCWTFDPFRSFPPVPERRPGAWPDLDMLPVHGDGGHLAQPPALGPDVGHHRAQSYCSLSQWDSRHRVLSQPITNKEGWIAEDLWRVLTAELASSQPNQELAPDPDSQCRGPWLTYNYIMI